MSADVIDFASRLGGAPSRRPLRLFVDANGCLQIQERNAKGAAIAEWELDERATDRLLLRLRSQHATVMREKHYAAHPEDRPKPARERQWRKCGLTVCNNVGRRGCARRTGHDGKHRDREGREWTAAFPHHRFCAALIVIGGSLAAGVRPVEVDVPEAMRALFGPRAVIYVGADGRCMRCKNIVGLEVVT